MPPIEFQIVEFDMIPIPTERARDKQPIQIIQRDHPAWPGETFDIRFDYNSAAAKWIWQVILDDYGTIIPQQPADYARGYEFGDYISFVFLDLARTAEHVTPETLGSSVELAAFPGPASPGYEEWLHKQRIEETDSEE